jgi:hypothetical protein
MPCPRCLIKKSALAEMGRFRDMRGRIRDSRTDTVQRQRRIKVARNFIFNKGSGINGARVRALLDESSYVPTIVRCLLHFYDQQYILIVLECIFRASTRV